MKQIDLIAKGIKLVLEDNVLAVISEKTLDTSSSAFHNGGGQKKTKAILNIQVTRGYGDRLLHENPDAFIVASAKKVGLAEDFVGMVTAAAVKNFALVSKRDGDLGVSVVATAADDEGNTCSHSESAGENIQVQPIEGTINIIVIIDGNPTESALISCIITATEAKTAALRELDLRSRYSGDEATGTVTDAMVVAKTSRGQSIIYAGPASKLGQLVGYCTREAVREATVKGHECAHDRGIQKRLAERHLSIEKLSAELAKAKCLDASQQTIAATLKELLETEPIFASVVFASVALSEEFEHGRNPSELGDAETLGQRFGSLASKQSNTEKSDLQECDHVDLPVFLKHTLIALLKRRLSEKKN